MEPKVTKFSKYLLTYFNREELKIIIKEIFKEKIYEIELQSSTPTIFDVGAHIGIATIYFKEKYPNATVFAFEPNPNVFPLLEENLYFNNIKNVKVFNIALGRRASKRTLFIDSSSNGCFSTASFQKDAWDGTQESIGIEVRTEPLSAFIKRNVDLLKLDTEGTEQEIIEELDSSKKLKLIRNIVIEFHPTAKQNIEKIKTILKNNSFSIETRENPKEKLVYILGKNSL